MNSKLFSGLIIAKNEEKHIKNAILSLKKFCSQIVVVDTGSVDNTANIASSLGCEVYFYKWEDDFAKARNYALSLARNEWIAFIDADELFTDFEITHIQEKLNNPKIGGINCIIKNYTNTQLSTFTEHRYTRIFRNNPNIRYSGAIHEQVADSILDAGLEIFESDIEIEHFGYIDSPLEKKNRNKKLLYNELRRDPSDWNKFHIANTEFALNNFAEAKQLYSSLEDSRELSPDNLELSKLRLLQIALNLNQYDYIADNLSFKFENKNYEGLKQFIFSAYYLSNGDIQNAYSALLISKSCKSSLVENELLEKSISTLKGYVKY